MKTSVPYKKKEFQPDRQHAKKFSAIAISVLLIFLSLSVYALNTIRVNGRITSETGQPVPGASIVVSGSTTGTATDDNGNFAISAPPNGTLTITSIGYATQE